MMRINSAKYVKFIFIWMILLIISACNQGEDLPKEIDNGNANLIIKLEVNPEQIRLGNNGTPSPLPEGNSGQDPVFDSISAHYLEFAPDAITPL